MSSISFARACIIHKRRNYRPSKHPVIPSSSSSLSSSPSHRRRYQVRAERTGFDVTIFFHPLLIVLAQLPRHPRIPKLNMSVSSAYFPIIFFSLVPSLLFNALLLAYPYHLLLVRGEQRDLILGLSMTPCTLLLPPVPPAAIPTLPSFLFPLSLSLLDHATHRACCFVYPLRTSIHGEERKELFSAHFDKRLRR